MIFTEIKTFPWDPKIMVALGTVEKLVRPIFYVI